MLCGHLMTFSATFFLLSQLTPPPGLLLWLSNCSHFASYFLPALLWTSRCSLSTKYFSNNQCCLCFTRSQPKAVSLTPVCVCVSVHAHCCGNNGDNVTMPPLQEQCCRQGDERLLQKAMNESRRDSQSGTHEVGFKTVCACVCVFACLLQEWICVSCVAWKGGRLHS